MGSGRQWQSRSSPSKGQADFMPWRNIVAPHRSRSCRSALRNSRRCSRIGSRQLAAVGVEDASVGLGLAHVRAEGRDRQPHPRRRLRRHRHRPRPFTDYDALVKDWLATVGTTAKSEYEQAYAAAQKASETRSSEQFGIDGRDKARPHVPRRAA